MPQHTVGCTGRSGKTCTIFIIVNSQIRGPTGKKGPHRNLICMCIHMSHNLKTTPVRTRSLGLFPGMGFMILKLLVLPDNRIHVHKRNALQSTELCNFLRLFGTHLHVYFDCLVFHGNAWCFWKCPKQYSSSMPLVFIVVIW